MIFGARVREDSSCMPNYTYVAIKRPSATSPMYETKNVMTKKVIMVMQNIP